MTATFDRFWISRGIEASELKAVKGRNFLYAAFTAMSGTAGFLIFGIASNLVG